MVVAEAMWWWLRRLCGGGCGGYVVAVVEAMWWVLEELELKQALRYSFGLGLCKNNHKNSGHFVLLLRAAHALRLDQFYKSSV